MEQMPSNARWRKAQERDPEYIAAMADWQSELHEQGVNTEPGEYRPPATEYTLAHVMYARMLWYLDALARQHGVEPPDGMALLNGPDNPLAEALAQRKAEDLQRDTREAFDVFASLLTPRPESTDNP